MGMSAMREQRGRMRERAARIERAIAQRHAADPDQVRRGQRINAVVTDGRRALRARNAARRAEESARARAGVAVRRLLDEGLSMSDAAALLTLPRSAARRLMRDAADAAGGVNQPSSTAVTETCDSRDAGAHSESQQHDDQRCHE